MDLISLLKDYEPQLLEAERVFVGYSGGLDSTLLLHSVVHLLGKDKVCALHANHQLQKESGYWNQHCRAQAKSLGIEFRDIDLDIVNQGEGVESQARKLRYQFFRQQLKKNDLILLGHHLDDQAETLLYRLFRGAGSKGLAAIPVQRKEGEGQLIRPLLNFSRKQLKQIALDSKLQWIEDPSNADTGYDRNYIRQEVLPVICKRWPSASTTLGRAAANLASANSLLDEYGKSLLEKLDWRSENWGYSFDLLEFELLSEQAQAHLLATAFDLLELHGFDSRYLSKVLDLLDSGEETSPLLEIGSSQLRRFAKRLYLMPAISPLAEKSLTLRWSGQDELVIPGCGTLKSIPDYQGVELEVRFRCSGDRCQPLQRPHSQSLKKLMQEYRLEPWLRERTPVICKNNKIVAVANLFSCSAELGDPKINWQLT